MSRHNARHGGTRIVIGLIVILIGVLALLDKMQLFEMRLLASLWPLALVVAGVLRLARRRHVAGSGTSQILGLGLIAVGTALTLSKLGYINFQMRDWWPALLIGAGLLVLFKGLSSDARGESQSRGPGAVLGLSSGSRQSSDAVLHATGVLGGGVIRNDSQAFQGGEVDAFMGGVEIDLRQASIETEAVLNVFAMWGGITIKVPLDWSVQVNAMALLGGIDDKSVPPMNPTKRLRIEGQAIMGGVEIRN